MTVIQEPSCKSLYIEMFFNDQILSSGTAFVVSYRGSYFLITNRHNFTGRDNNTGALLNKNAGIPNKVLVWHNDKAGLGNWAGVQYQLIDNDNKPLWIEHPMYGAKADIVAFKIDEKSKVELYSYSLDDNNLIKSIDCTCPDRVSVVGFPFGKASGGKFAIWATGYVATDYDLSYDSMPVFLIDCRTRRGQSGSPVIFYSRSGQYVNSNGTNVMTPGPITKLLGVYSSRINKDSDLGMVWKVEALKDLIGSNT